jgi:hypothetical protein
MSALLTGGDEGVRRGASLLSFGQKDTRFGGLNGGVK